MEILQHKSLSPNITKDKIEYTVALVSDFAKKYSLSETDAFNYLDKFEAISFIDEHYNVAHTLSFEEMVENVAIYCRKNGGAL